MEKERAICWQFQPPPIGESCMKCGHKQADHKPAEAKSITQKQLDLCEVALNIAALQSEVSSAICLGNNAPSLGNELRLQAAVMRELAKLIGTKQIVGMQILRATSLEKH